MAGARRAGALPDRQLWIWVVGDGAGPRWRLERQWFDRFGDKLRFRGKNSDQVRDSLHFSGTTVYLDRNPIQEAALRLETLDD